MITRSRLADRLRYTFISASVLTLAAGLSYLPALAQERSPSAAQPAAPAAAEQPDTTAEGPAVSVNDKDRPTISKKKPVGPNSQVTLLNLLVKQGVLTEDQVADLVKQAQEEDYVARQAARDAATKAEEANKTATAAAAAASPPGSKRVTYVPEIVKRQLRDDLRKEVMAQAKNEGWASPGLYPEWASRIRFSGDFRARWEAIRHPSGYNSVGRIYDFNAVNTGSAYDVSNISNPNFSAPLYNTTENRERSRLRARLGLEADLDEGFTAGMRIATGSDSSPVSTNQTMGGSGGNFSKYSLWLDRAYLRYEPFKSAGSQSFVGQTSVNLTVGRFDNPFWNPTELMWDADLGFDGIAMQARHELSSGFTPFAVAGAFPVFNTSLDFASVEGAKFKSEDKYLFGGQLGFLWQPMPLIAITFGASIFDFHNVQARLSSPCDLSVAKDCDTDTLRPSFAQKGNTYTYLRDIIPNAANGNGTTNQYQYFGLAGAYRPAVFASRLEFAHFDPVHIALDGEYVWNTAFNRGTMERLAINNRAADQVSGVTNGAYEGGNKGWLARVTVGNTKLQKFGDWNVSGGYKYLESDATVDAFVDSDFGLGGTNLKGYFLGANYALSKSVYGSARWLSANQIAGAPYAVDLFQLDLNAKF